MKKLLLISFFSVFVVLFSQAQMVDDTLIPVLNIETINGEMPTYTIVNAPEGCIGTSITDNNYVSGRMVMTLKGETLYDSGDYEKNVSGMRIKVRGNSTGAYMNQHPYKIKLSKKSDLLNRNDKAYKHKEWLLLGMYTWNKSMTNQESNILHIAGLTISKILGMSWTPEYDFVHVVLNGDYQGMYYLIEPVSKGEKRVDIENSGFLIEHDTFWWNEDVYFKTERQGSTCAFTYKYPDSDDVTEEIQNNIKSYMDEVEECIYNKAYIMQHIDLESFAKWMLVHDILGTDDSAGCNRFLCRKDNTSLLQMGPTWDYDSTFRSDSWSSIHSLDWFYYPQLFLNEAFVNTYVNIWHTIRPTLMNSITTSFEEVWQKYVGIFDESMKIHQTKYPYEGQQTLKEQIDEIIGKFNERIAILDELMHQYDGSTSIEKTHQEKQVITITDLMGHQYKNKKDMPHGLYIYHYNNGRTKKIAH